MIDDILSNINITDIKFQVIVYIFVIAIIEILKFVLKSEKVKRYINDNKLKTIIFILSIFITAIPVILLYDFNSLNEFVGIYAQTYIQIQGIYNVIKNMFRISITNFLTSNNKTLDK